MSRILIFFIKLIIILICHQVLTTNADDRIVGGIATTIDKNKYIVSLRLKVDGRFFCGGTLVKKRFVVTAAHCVEQFQARDFTVHGGVSFISQKGVERNVVNMVVPKAFNMQNLTMDWAVLKLSGPMQGENISTIPLCSHALHENDVVKVSGWGFTSENSTDPARQLRTTNVRMISNKVCTQQYRGSDKITRTMMCASVPGEKDACSGDSGGPLVHKDQLCGVVSFGNGCARKKYPGVYTNVNVVKKLILRAIKKMS